MVILNLALVSNSTQRRKPTRLVGLGGFCASRRYDLLRFAHPHTHTGLQQQQQQSVVVELGIIVIADLLYRLPAKLA
jgi:hypothetical protein